MITAKSSLRGLLALVALSNGLIGLLGVMPAVPISKLATAFYSASITTDPQVEHISEMLGAYMLAFGLLAGFAAFDPVRYRVVGYTAAGFLLLRVAQRIAFAAEQSEVFGISGAWYWGQTALFLSVALGLLLCSHLARRESSGRITG